MGGIIPEFVGAVFEYTKFKTTQFALKRGIMSEIFYVRDRNSKTEVCFDSSFFWYSVYYV